MRHVPAFPRSFLYVPGDRPDLFAKAQAGDADAVILDLEDAVPVAGRAAARAEVTAWLPTVEEPDRWWVRLDPTSLAEDLRPVAESGAAGVVLAKVSLAALDEADAILRGIGAAASGTSVVGLVESAATYAALAQLVRHPRLLTLGIGEVDLLADLGIVASERTAEAIDALRTQVVVQCAAAGLRAPIAPTSTRFRELDEFADTTRLLHELGFGSRTAIHPGQVAVIHRVLTPTAEELASAAEVVARFEEAGQGVAVDGEGRLIDAAVVRQARRTLSRQPSH